MEGKKFSPTWSQPCSISGTPETNHAETDHWSIQQRLIHTRRWTALHLFTINYGKTPSTHYQPQCMAPPMPGWTVQTLQYPETRKMKPRHNNQIPHCTNSMTTSCWTSWLHLFITCPQLSLTAQVQPNRLSSLALLQCTLKFKYYNYFYIDTQQLLYSTNNWSKGVNVEAMWSLVNAVENNSGLAVDFQSHVQPIHWICHFNIPKYMNRGIHRVS